MTRVDFHFNTPDKLAYGCRLLRKVLRSGHRIAVTSDDEKQLREFDAMLWTFSKHDFIPHVLASDSLSGETPVVLTTDLTQIDHHDIVVNLGNATPKNFGRFERLLELVSNDDTDRAAARERWRFYRDRGYEIKRHDLTGQ